MKNKLLTLWLILCSVTFSQTQQTDIEWPTLANSPWPMIKHDPQFTGRSPYRGPQTPTIVWTADMKDGIFSGPVIGEEGNLYFGSYYYKAASFYSFSPQGTILWEYVLEESTPPQSGILIDSSNTVYFGGTDGYLYALNQDGTLKWRIETGNIAHFVSPNIDLEGNIYVTNFPNGELFSIKNEGTINWQLNIDDNFKLKSPVISPDGNIVYIFGSDSLLYSINLDGTIKWKFSVITTLLAPLIDSDGNIYFYDQEVFYSIYPDGNLRWEREDFYFSEHSIPTIDINGNIYTIAIENTYPYNRVLLSLRNNGGIRWTYTFNDKENDDFLQPLICDNEGTIYVGSTYGNYYYAISNQGELLWKLPLKDYQVDNTGAIAEDGTLYLGVHKSTLVTNQERTLIAIKDTATTIVEEVGKIHLFSLSQNYPNPFNLGTKIKIIIETPLIFSSLAKGRTKEEFVTLKVYDTLGKEVQTLINKYLSPGNYEVEFNVNDLPSGIYFYKLTTNNFSKTKKMMLIR
ncbi:PQQ-binding-like beta-propeller repeat protein [Bacteroidota bacterium]